MLFNDGADWGISGTFPSNSNMHSKRKYDSWAPPLCKSVW